MQIYRSDDHLSVTLYIKHEIAVGDDGHVKWGDNLSTQTVAFAIDDVRNLLKEELPDGFYQKFTLADHYVMLNATNEVGARWPITEEIYNHFLEMLPPMYCAGGFYMSEANHHTEEGVVRSKYYLSGGKYWHEYVLIPHKNDDQMEKEHY